MSTLLDYVKGYPHFLVASLWTSTWQAGQVLDFHDFSMADAKRGSTCSRPGTVSVTRRHGQDIHIFWWQACGKTLSKRRKSLNEKEIQHTDSQWAGLQQPGHRQEVNSGGEQRG
ncbi:hypothetical protein [Herbaspirillum sp. NPDC087042]|uniref:hypothetical protein n=1 Tax=Herbaspirillum sp. NPDC087042 TaxID=3364004 RepID=UPI00381708EF